MRKIGYLLFAIILLLSLCACTYQDPVLSSLPDYNSKTAYISDGVQDFTGYTKYFYDSITAQNLEVSECFAVVATENVEEIVAYVDNFEEWVETVGGELKENYDFDKSIVAEGDYFCIKTKFGERIGVGERTYGKFDNYSVYYFDVDTQVLYYFHNNI